MIKININGKFYETDAGQKVIEAALKCGVQLPHFCWHPELSVSGNCRMCLVELGSQKKNRDGSLCFTEDGKPEIAFMPKLQAACSSNVNDGMYILTDSPKVQKAREAVMEFILVNHPLDCPICDEAGNCKLQNYSFSYGNGVCRFTDNKNHKPKRVSLNEYVMYDAERCISCSRCIRVTKEILKQPVLTFVNRGDRSFVKLADGLNFDSPYSMNIIDTCPVGALTSKDFRFKARVWDMAFNRTICNGCAAGCNIEVGSRNNEVLRIQPEQNEKVNHSWMCDAGRLNYEYLNNGRLSAPHIKNDGKSIASDWNNAISTAAGLLKKFSPDEVFFVLSAKSTFETDYLLLKLISKSFKIANTGFVDYRDKNFGDSFLRSEDLTPNRKSLELLFPKIKPIDWATLKADVTRGKIKLLYIVDSTPKNDELIDIAKKCKNVILHGVNDSELSSLADVALASAAFAEDEGTYINGNGIVQHLTPAIATQETITSMIRKLGRFVKFGTEDDDWGNLCLRDVRSDCSIIASLIKAVSPNNEKYKSAEEVFNEASGRVPELKGFTYRHLDEFGGVVLGTDPDKAKKYPKYNDQKLFGL